VDFLEALRKTRESHEQHEIYDALMFD